LSIVVRIVESFLYAGIITGEQVDITKAEQAIAALLVRD
jgi:Tetracyclin repressor-like, C-terminal domain